MRPRLLPVFVGLLLAVGLAVIGCGGSGDDGGAPDLAKIATATLPNPLPEPTILTGAGPPPQGTTYTVQAGDTLSSIAAQFGATVEAIVQANAIADPTRLEVGQVLIIPEAGAPPRDVLGATAEPPTTPQAGGQQTYTVQAGDNAAAIADSFGITVDELAAANTTTVDDLRDLEVGETLVIPAPAATPAP